MRFLDRADAGKKLAVLLQIYKGAPNAIVLGIARGGVVTAAAVAKILNLPLDVIVVRKIGAPYQSELALAAITDNGTILRNNDLIKQMGISDGYILSTATKELEECKYRVQLYRQHYPAVSLQGKTVLLIDDGIATGISMEAAIVSAREHLAQEVIVAVPVLPEDIIDRLRVLTDKLFFLQAEKDFVAVGSFYQNFTQVEHEEVIAILKDCVQGKF